MQHRHANIHIHGNCRESATKKLHRSSEEKKSPTTRALAFILQWHKTGICETCEKSNEKQRRWTFFWEIKDRAPYKWRWDLAIEDWCEQRGGDSTKHNGKLNLWLGLCVFVEDYVRFFSPLRWPLTFLTPIFTSNVLILFWRTSCMCRSLLPLLEFRTRFSLYLCEHMNISTMHRFLYLLERHAEWHTCAFLAFLFSEFLDWM